MVSPTRRPTTCSTSSSASVERVALVNSATARHQPLRAVSARPSLLSAVGKGGATRDHARAEDACGGVAPCTSVPQLATPAGLLETEEGLDARGGFSRPQAASLREGALHDTAARQHAQRWRAHVSYGCALRRAARCPPRLMGGLGSAPRRVGAPRAITGMAMFAASIAYGCSLYSASIAYGYRLNAWQTDWNKYFVRLPGCTRLGIDE